MNAIIKLTRWKEFVPFTLPLTLLGGLLAYRFVDDVRLDQRLIFILIANCLAIAYAFMINDIEDAEDDKHESGRASRNAVASGDISKRDAWLASGAIVLLSALFYALGGPEAFIVGIVILLLSHLYSWKPVRLKSMPIFDIASHILFLAALLMLASYVAYTTTFTLEIWAMMICSALFSAYGQFYNQVRDFDADQAAGLKNTASLIGKPATQLLSLISIPGAALLLLFVIARGAFPLWLAGVVIITAPIVFFLAKGRDMRGDETDDMVGEGQVQFLIVVNITLFVWYIAVLLEQ